MAAYAHYRKAYGPSGEALRVARAGQVLAGPHTHIVFLETSADTSGARLTFKQMVQPHSPATPEHLHPKQAETFRVLSGKMGVRANGSERVLEAGEVVTVPAGTPHAMWNAGDEMLEQEIWLEPALRSETFFETVVGLERDGELPEGKPTLSQLLQFSLLAPYYDNPLAAIPLKPQRIFFGVLGAVARLFGYRAWYPKYSPHGAVELPLRRQASQQGVR